MMIAATARSRRSADPCTHARVCVDREREPRASRLNESYGFLMNALGIRAVPTSACASVGVPHLAITRHS
ncbi:hypothetical protein WK80_05095 [Burkholderia multivorans]|nr:hypothetical protein WK80_05095 [Burkholderia multivorans]KWH26409.1 hypothetical protein WL98_06900 [Burkholderia multivorans]